MLIVLPLFLTPITPSLYLIKLLNHVQLVRGADAPDISPYYPIENKGQAIYNLEYDN